MHSEESTDSVVDGGEHAGAAEIQIDETYLNDETVGILLQGIADDGQVILEDDEYIDERLRISLDNDNNLATAIGRSSRVSLMTGAGVSVASRRHQEQVERESNRHNFQFGHDTYKDDKQGLTASKSSASGLFKDVNKYSKRQHEADIDK